MARVKTFLKLAEEEKVIEEEDKDKHGYTSIDKPPAKKLVQYT